MSPFPANAEKPSLGVERQEHVGRPIPPNETVLDDEGQEETNLHLRTWLALISMGVLQYTSLLALVGPPTVLDNIGDAFPNAQWRYWIVNAAILVQAALGPVFSSISDVFQVRKSVIVSLVTLAFIGSTIIPNSDSIYRVIGGSVMIGFGLAAAPLSYAVPSEIVPRRWRSASQGFINLFGGLGAITGPLVIGELTQKNDTRGWRNFYWVQSGLWGFTAVGVLIGYLPRKRHMDKSTIIAKLKSIDWIGSGILMGSITLFVAGFSFQSVFGWGSGQVIGPMVMGVVGFVVFGLYESYGTKTGIIPHGLFEGDPNRGWTVLNFAALFFIEGATFFSIVTFYPAMTSVLFTADPLAVAVRQLPLFCFASAFTLVFGWLSSYFRDIKYTLFTGFVFYTAGIIGLATIQPGQTGVAIGTLSLAGIGLAGPLILILTGVQLAVPHHLLATATALVVSCRTLAGSIFTAAYSTALSTRLNAYIPSYIGRAVAQAGLPPASIGPFIGAFAGNDRAALVQIPGVTPVVLGAAGAAFQQAFADAVRIVYEIAAPLGAVACILCLLLPSFKNIMDRKVEAPLEKSGTLNEDVA